MRQNSYTPQRGWGSLFGGRETAVGRQDPGVGFTEDRATAGNDLEMLMLFYYAGFEDLGSVRDIQGKTVGHVAAWLGFTSIIVFLKNETKFSFHQKDDGGLTPFDEAVQSGHKEIEFMLQIK